MDRSVAIKRLTDRWETAKPAERSNAQLYLTELAEALGVERPRPSGAGYEFEYQIRIVTRDGTETVRRADLYKRDCFLLEAKDEKNGEVNDVLLRKAFGQAVEYAVFVPGDPPPYLMVLDVGTCLMLWDRWHGTYGGYRAGQRIDLRTLHEKPDNIELLRDVWETPHRRNPRATAESVTKEIARHLGELAASLEQRGHGQESVARFLIRIVFTLFAEDVDLLQDRPLARLLELSIDQPEEFSDGVTELWRAMDTGSRFGVHKLLRYNGRFFRNAEALTLTRKDLSILLEAAAADWAEVEPSIFGTLFTRAIEPAERHRLGAEFTPPPYVERLVHATIEEPVREQWAFVQAEILQLRKRGRKTDLKAATTRLRKYHEELRQLRILDPACGSGNFLYVALATLKRVELEVVREIESLTGHPELQIEEVNPSQFYGIEIKPWAREISELTLWIGYHQWWRQTHGHAQPPEPVLQDTGTLECRDAVLTWTRLEEDPSRSRPDPTPKIKSPVTGELVPDPDARLPYMVHVDPRLADWPEADFIVGNPPYMGRGRQRDAFGDGYVDALRRIYADVPDNADYVMYWWHRAAQEVSKGRTKRAGLITTNTIRQRHNRAVIERARQNSVQVIWAIPDHPWIDETGSAAVRVSMTVLEKDSSGSTLVRVNDNARIVERCRVARLGSDLTVNPDVSRTASEQLLSNKGLSSQGFILVGNGFILSHEEANRFSKADPSGRKLIRHYLTGRDLTSRARDQYVIDFGLLSHDQVREYAVLYDVVRDRVKPGRDANARSTYRKYWWRFGEPRRTFRPALQRLPRFIATVETSKHRIFVFLDQDTTPSHTIVCIALDDFYHLGVLSSTIHVSWALAAGGRLGVGNDPRYQKAHCFDPFPFPNSPESGRKEVARLMERIDRHREQALARDERITMTSMYNVRAKLMSDEVLSSKEREIQGLAACGVLKDLHDELDRSVAGCYGWSWPLSQDALLQNLVNLHDSRRAEEASGHVQWLRPQYQQAMFAKQPESALAIDSGSPSASPAPARPGKQQWPIEAVEQLRAVKAAVAKAPGSMEEISSRFSGSRRILVGRHLETLAILAEIQQTPNGRYHTTASETG